MRHVEGDIFTTEAKALGHGVNCEGVMGAGIAKEVRRRYPELYKHYRQLCKRGELSPGGLYVYDAGDHFVYNIASQDLPGPHARLEWVAEGVRAALAHAHEKGLEEVALPKIASNIGGLLWEDVEEVLKEVEAESPVELVIYSFVP